MDLAHHRVSVHSLLAAPSAPCCLPPIHVSQGLCVGALADNCSLPHIYCGRSSMIAHWHLRIGAPCCHPDALGVVASPLDVYTTGNGIDGVIVLVVLRGRLCRLTNWHRGIVVCFDGAYWVGGELVEGLAPGTVLCPSLCCAQGGLHNRGPRLEQDDTIIRIKERRMLMRRLRNTRISDEG